jgi:hypothetical protein
MRSIKAPDAAPPLADRPVTSSGESSGQPAGATSKLSLSAGLFAFLLNHFSSSDRFHLSHGARLGILVVCAVLILAGCALAVVAVRAHRRRPLPGVIAFVVAAAAVNAVLLIALAYGVLRTLTHRGP